jgi:hypothetical protein
MPISAPLPARDPLVIPPKMHAAPVLIDWATALSIRTDQSSQRIADPVALESQGASIGTTPIPSGALGAGLYRVSWYARITRAATTSSSLTVTIGWTESAVSLALSGAALTGNTITTVQSGSALLQIDQASPVTYSTAYASVGGTSMLYTLTVVLERIA